MKEKTIEGLGVKKDFDGSLMIGFWIGVLFEGKGLIYYGNGIFLKGEFHGREHCIGYY